MTALMARSRRGHRFLTILVVGGVLVLAALLGSQPSNWYLLLGAGALGGALLLQQPGLGLLALAGLSFTLPFTFGTGSEVDLTPPVLLIPAVTAVWLVDGLRRGVVRLPRSRTALPLLLFVLCGLLSLLAGRAYWDPSVPQPGNLLLVQLAQWAIFALSAVIFVVTGDLGARGNGRWLRYATWLFLALGAVVVLETYLPPLALALDWSSPEMANRSMFWVWLSALATGQLLFNRRLGAAARLGLLALLLAAGYTIVFRERTWSSGWVPFTTALVAVVGLWIWRRSRVAAVTSLLVLVVMVIVLFPVLFAHAGGEQELLLSWGGRQKLYAATLDLVKDHPFLGLGPAAYRHYGYNHWLSLGIGRALYLRPLVSSHNNYIDVYAQQGLVGLALFLWFLLEVVLLGWRLKARFGGDFEAGYVHGALAGLAGTLVAMMLADWFLPFVYNTGFPAFRTSALAWMFLGGLVALEQKSRQAEQAHDT